MTTFRRGGSTFRGRMDEDRFWAYRLSLDWTWTQWAGSADWVTVEAVS